LKYSNTLHGEKFKHFFSPLKRKFSLENSLTRDNLTVIINIYKDKIARISYLSSSERPEEYTNKLLSDEHL